MSQPVMLPLDAETKGAEVDHKAELRLWLRLLTCATLIETEVRRRLHRQFKETLPRFDLMAQLERHPQGLKMNELSRLLMVTGGNVTAIVYQLEKEGLATIHERHAAGGKFTRENVKAMGLKILPVDERYASNTVTALPSTMLPMRVKAMSSVVDNASISAACPGAAVKQSS